MKILIAEDDVHVNSMLCELLRHNGYTAVSAYSGTEALLLLSQDSYSLLLLDLMLPGKTGEDVLSHIRQTSNVPVIVLTARADKDTTVDLLRLGADDYIVKPFDNNELLARIDALLRRVLRNPASQEEPETLRYKDIILSGDIFDALINGQKVGLSKREYEILKLLMSYPNKVYSKNNIYESVWGTEFYGDENTINVHISKIRGKLAVVSPDIEYIQTVWGIGFKMV